MPFTQLEQKLRKEAEEIARLAQVNISEADMWEKGLLRTTNLQIAINKMVVAAVVQRYTLFEEILKDIICNYYLGPGGKKPHLRWKQKKFSTFVHYIMDEMYLLKKMELVNAIEPLPKELKETLRKVNAIRNSLAHSFIPENRKEHTNAGKVLYAGMDIRSPEGLKLFLDDCIKAWDSLATRAYALRVEDTDDASPEANAD